MAERLLITVFNRQSVEAWRTMVNDISIDKLCDHFIICGYGQVGRTVVDQLTRLDIPFVLIETSESLGRELLKDKVLPIQGRRQTPRHSSRRRHRTRAQARYAQAMPNSGADEGIIPEYEGGLMTGRMIAKYYPVLTNLQ